MAEYTIIVHSKVSRLRFKYRDSPHLNDILSNILWYSFPVVYPYHMQEWKKVSYELDKIKNKRKRIRKYIRGMLATFNDLYLVTLTFDSTYETTNTDSRKKYSQRWLNDNTLDYYACLDFGKENNREHYHCICAFDIPLKSFAIRNNTFYSLAEENSWSYGFYSIRKIKSDSTSVYKTLNYAFKAGGYSFKSASYDSVKPFHKRKVEHFDFLLTDSVLL